MIDWILLIIWFYLGIIHFISEKQPTKLSYGLVWVSLMFFLVENIVK